MGQGVTLACGIGCVGKIDEMEIFGNGVFTGGGGVYTVRLSSFHGLLISHLDSLCGYEHRFLFLFLARW